MMEPELKALLERANEWVRNASRRHRAEMKAAQRASFIRAMTTPCEHGVLDFETCPDCLQKYT